MYIFVNNARDMRVEFSNKYGFLSSITVYCMGLKIF